MTAQWPVGVKRKTAAAAQCDQSFSKVELTFSRDILKLVAENQIQSGIGNVSRK